MKGNFQIILLVIFIFAAIGGVLVFSGAIPIGKDEAGSLGTVVLWGTVPNSLISIQLGDFNRDNSAFNIEYEEKSADTFDRDLLEALASGTGPDMFFLTDDLVYSYSNKIVTIPYTSYPLATFKNVFAEAGEVFLTEKGILAFPMSIDPLMMYYNRGMLDANGITSPPATWDDLSEMVSLLNKKDESNKIIKSAVALGHHLNVVHAKDILAALFIQAGNPIIREENEKFVSTLSSPIGNYNIPSILNFYTNFANPLNIAYSWNRSFPDSDDAFSKEDLAIYFGYASELLPLIKKNPNQNFFVAGIPQIRDANFKATKARVLGIAISSSSKNITGAFTAANALVSSDFAVEFATATMIPPARRDLLAQKPIDAFFPIFYNSALYAKSWPDPSPKDSTDIFNGMINDVISNNVPAERAVSNADSRLRLLLIK